MPLDQQRLNRFRAILADGGIDCYLACMPISMGYLAGFFESGGERLLVLAVRPEGEPAMIVPALSKTHASATGIQDIRSWSDGEDPYKLFEDLSNEWRLQTAVIGVDDETPACYLLEMQRVLPAALFKCAGDEMALLRKRKSAEELALMRRAAHIADAAVGDVLASAPLGKTETAIASIINSAMTDRGGSPTFCIVAAGANGAEPHHVSGRGELKYGDVVVMDWGCSLEHYLSDTTRTICVGRASDEAKAVYRIVREAHMAAREVVRPGIACEEVDKAARAVIEAAGYGEYFIHRTGHGIGLMGHEPPHMVKGSVSLLEEGQCFSVEPGIYLPGRFGVRIENIVAVTSDGHESLNSEPAIELIEVGA
jgi:Xaa-Pro aminopeptidase